MTKEIKSAEELEALMEGRLRATHPTVDASIVVILRTEDGDSNWTVSHSEQPDEVVAAFERVLPEMQARYELAPPGEGSA